MRGRESGGKIGSQGARGDCGRVAGASHGSKRFLHKWGSSSQPLKEHHLDEASGPRLTVPQQPRGPHGFLGSWCRRKAPSAGVGD